MTHAIFGTWQIAGAPSFQECSKSKALNILEHAYTAGVRIYDTAPIYGYGKAEEYLWEFAKGKREDITIITKFGFDWWENMQTYIDLSAKWIEKQVQKSLERLQTDYIDIYFLHIPEEGIYPEEILKTLNTLKGKWHIKSYGVCNMYERQLQSFLHHPFSQVEYIQDFYNIIERKAENLIFPYLWKEHKFLAYSPLYRWVLTSQSMKDLFKRNEDAINMLIKNQSLPYIYKQKRSYEKLSQEKNIDLESIALNFLKRNEKVYGIILGTQNTDHLDSGVQTIHSD